MRYLAVLFVLMALMSLTAHASDGAENEVGDALDSYYSSLPDEIRDALPDSLEAELTENGTASSVGPTFIAELISNAVKLALKDSAPLIISLTVTVILSSIISSQSDGISDKPLSVAGSVAAVFLCASAILPLAEEVKRAVTLMGGVIKGVMPAVAVVGAASAQPSLTAANASWLSTLLALNSQLTEDVLTPAVSVCLAFTAAGALTSGSTLSLSGVATVIKRCFIFLLTLIATALTVIMSFQTVLAKGSDTVLVRSLRFASGTAVPVIGGTVSEVAGGYLSSLTAVRGSLGTVCAAALAVCALPLTLKIFAMRLGMSGVALLARSMGSPLHNDIRELTSVTDLLIAITVLTAVTLTLSVGAFAAVSVQ